MGRIEQLVRPRTVEEALAILSERRDRAAVLAGGTSLALRLPPAVDTLVDIGGLGLRGIEDRGDSVAILAGTPVADLLELQPFRDYYGGVVRRAAARVASTPLRNLITVGGNAYQVLPWSDLPGLWLALGCRFVATGPGGDRAIPAHQFYASHPRNALHPTEILTEIQVPKPVGRFGTSFVKVSRTRFDYAALSVTVVARLEGPVVADCAIVLGAVKPLPVRVPPAEDEVSGLSPGREQIVRAAARAAGAVDPVGDVRFSVDYRRHLIKVWVKRCLAEAVGGGEQR